MGAAMPRLRVAGTIRALPARCRPLDVGMRESVWKCLAKSSERPTHQSRRPLTARLSRQPGWYSCQGRVHMIRWRERRRETRASLRWLSRWIQPSATSGLMHALQRAVVLAGIWSGGLREWAPPARRTSPAV